MSVTAEAPLDERITLAQLTADPYPLYARMRRDTPVLRVAALGRTLLTKADDTRRVKLDPALFSSDDPGTPMERAFLAKTLMRRDGEDHMRLRAAMMPAFAPAVIRDVWVPRFNEVVRDYVERLPASGAIDFFPDFAGPVAARALAHLLGMTSASDDEMQRWSQTLIDGAGNFGWQPGPFERSDAANAEIDACLVAAAEQARAEPNDSALSVQVNAAQPIAWPDILANIKIAIGGGLNEPRDSLLTVLFGLLDNPEQCKACQRGEASWSAAFDEAVRWVAPIQVSSRRVTSDTTIRGFHIPAGDVVMTVQASANHDEDLVQHGERFDLFRKAVRHQAFGNGPHFCLGTHVAKKLVGEIALPLLFERFPGMRLADRDAVVWSGFGFRGPLNLPIVLA